MISLRKHEMEYLASGDEPYKEKLDDDRKKLIDTFIGIDDFFVYMDSHGLNIYLCVYKETEDGPTLGFLYASGSEESFYGTDYFGTRDLGPFEVDTKEVVRYEYSRTDGGPFCS